MKATQQLDRIFIFSAVGVAIASWQFGFNLGAFKTIFFEHIFTVWVASLAIMLASLCLPKTRRPISGLGLIALASPTLWLVTQFMSIMTSGSLAWVSFIIGTTVLAVSMPYVGYILISISQTDGQSLTSKRHLIGLIAIASFVGFLGAAIGHYHPYVLSCEDFTLSGSFTPDNCWSNSSLLETK